jgi:hypothetical protein
MAGAPIDTAKGEHLVGALRLPAHAGAFHPLLDDVVHGALNGAAADQQPLGPKGAVTHAFAMRRQVTMQVVDRFELRGVERAAFVELRVPEQADHRFRSKPITDSGASRSPIPEQADRRVSQRELSDQEVDGAG